MVIGFPKYAKAVLGYIEPFSFHSTCQHSVTEMKPSLWTGVLVSNLSIYCTDLCQGTFRCWDCLLYLFIRGSSTGYEVFLTF